jgi:peptidoglycan/xylan/chitin deacetylase (PgdA/CDA1 family)
MIKAALLRSLVAVSRCHYAGVGVILSLHRVVPEGRQSLQPDNRALEITPETLEALITHLRSTHYRFATIEEVPALLAGPRGQRFVCFTFDDGYVDNLTHALPVFTKHGVPFSVNIVTSFADHCGLVWWNILEAVLERLDHIHAPWLENPQTLRLESREEKTAAFAAIATFLRTTGQPRRNEYVLELSEQADVDAPAISRQLVMDWEQIRQLSRSDLVTIGAHTVNHYTLNRLDEGRARAEILDGKGKIEAQLGRPVRHFAYPFGGRNADGRREFEIAGSCGFKTMVTTRSGCLFPEHKNHLNCLPRLTLSGNSPAVGRLQRLEGGLERLRHLDFQRVVTD